ncbi:histidine phosphatase family protein [Ferrimonas marina]|uniref:Broad specificity phosphatase PhoE n=1 Tax=Ferrimonas marina TaxID=299255 RepID=A0A1M5RJT7_9GAMM|nr:histidine phosphatase family protein [Ferrimonas marina]SHH26416.1 Broad specificity phosphatase PhoE [Ferrimonas marina]
MKVIYLVRHGQASFGADNYDKLSPLGHQQSAHVGQWLTEKTSVPDALFSGSLVRQRETLQASLTALEQQVKDSRGAPSPIQHDGWNEFDHTAVVRAAMAQRGLSRDELYGLNDDALMALFAEGMALWLTEGQSERFAESWPAFTERVWQAFSHCLEQTEEVGVVFSSGGPIATVLGRIWQLPTERVQRLSWTLVNASVSKILIGRQGPTVASFNEQHHLERAGKHFITYK